MVVADVLSRFRGFSGPAGNEIPAGLKHFSPQEFSPMLTDKRKLV